MWNVWITSKRARPRKENLKEDGGQTVSEQRSRWKVHSVLYFLKEKYFSWSILFIRKHCLDKQTRHDTILQSVFLTHYIWHYNKSQKTIKHYPFLLWVWKISRQPLWLFVGVTQKQIHARRAVKFHRLIFCKSWFLLWDFGPSHNKDDQSSGSKTLVLRRTARQLQRRPLSWSGDKDSLR